ncbi:hypothetical protein [Umezawaea beigongshangensis]|uniref:hypothetical protein n=1 Tax=Umezawaea beigongshangensis TaxID=2780383 RepID=UPI0018F14B8F|nr:hypothetical protein [Umezawaea beigongshangensis]
MTREPEDPPAAGAEEPVLDLRIVRLQQEVAELRSANEILRHIAEHLMNVRHDDERRLDGG